MCLQDAWADALIIQAVEDALNVTIQIVESNQGFALLTTVYPVQERNTSSIITIGHIDECHYVSTTALQSNASISMCNELTNDTQSSRNKHFIIPVIYVNPKSVLAKHRGGAGVREANYIYAIPCPTGPRQVPNSGSSV